MDTQRQGQVLTAPTMQNSAQTAAEARRSSNLWMVGLALLAFVVRAPGLFSGFVWDDAVSFEQHPKTALSRIPIYFTTNQSSLFGSNFYRPVLSTWYELFFSFFGAHPAPWHALSILLHVACTLLVFRLALIVIEKPFAAGAAAALFAVHPAHVEAISWASAIADPLWTMLMLSSVLAFLRWMERGSAAWFAASLLAGAASIFTKETAVVMPVVLLATVLALHKRAKPELPVLWATLPFFALAMLFLRLRQSVLHSFSHPLTKASDPQMAFTWPAALLFYLRHMFWPGMVVPFYPLRIVQSWRSAEFFVPLFAATAISAVLVYLLWRAAGWRRCLLCLAWTLIPLAPAFYLKALAPFELVHDRFLYAPLIGFCMAAALVLQWATERIEAVTQFHVFAILMIALIPVLALNSVSQGLWWQNDKTLFTRALAVTPDNPKAVFDLGCAIMRDGNPVAALPYMQRALQMDPRNSGALFGLGRIAWVQGDEVSAENYLMQALRIRPESGIWLHLASIHLHRKQLDKMEDDVLQAEALSPRGPGVHVAKGELLLYKNDPEGAIREFRKELENYPESQPALKGIQLAQAKQGR